ASGAQAVMRAMEKMRELVGRSTSGATELAASADQMTRMSRTLLDSMDRFVLDVSNGQGNGDGRGRNGQTHGKRTEGESLRADAARYAATARS
ncbi:MAG: hypothetical protein ACRD3R_07570, partial [Terriglobales bacterium]